MKKLLYTALAVVALGLTSCLPESDDADVWKSQNIDYSGTYLYALLDASDNSELNGMSSSAALEIYNTASDERNVLWFYDHEKRIEFKVKENLTGSPEDFASVSSAFADLNDNEVVISALPDAEPDAAGLSLVEARANVRISIEEGKILKDAATSKGGNVCDSLYIRLKTYGGNVRFVSVEKPEAEWAKPGVPEYKYVFDTVVDYDSSTDAEYILTGHRYTGFDEDHY